MKHLHTRLAAAIVGITLVMAAALLAVERFVTSLYYEELSQTLNAPIAMYVAGQAPLIENAVPDLDTLAEFAARAAVVNPAAELYLLAPDGRVLGHGLQNAVPALQSVDIAPIRAVIDGTAELPVRGDDPRDGELRKIFSAAEVRNGEVLEGYVYVILGGRTYEALAASLADTRAGRLLLAALLGITMLAASIGVLTSRLLTRRIRALGEHVKAVIESDFRRTVPRRPQTGGDEIDTLSRSFAELTERIRRQFEQLGENDRLRRELVSNVSHDLRTPLSAMLGYVETLLLRDDRLDAEERRRYLEIARRHGHRLGRLVADLFELSRIDSAAIVPEIEEFSLPELVQDTAQEFALEAERRGVTLSLDLPAREIRTRGDLGLIQRVLENLLRNAIRHTPAGGMVRIELEPRAHGVRVAVTDTGQGIAEQDLPRIFDRLYRGRRSGAEDPESSGIGLAIVKRILELHGSSVAVSTGPRSGACFEFELPIADQAA